MVLGIFGCATTNIDVCHAQCATKRRCVPGFTAEQETSCNADCDKMPGTFQDQDNQENQMCKNAAELRKQKLDCYSLGCPDIDACVQPLVAINAFNPKCVKN